MARNFRRFPASGKPGGVASRFLSVDFRPTTEFDSLLETKTPRLGWARAIICPCTGYNDQTKQLDPNCPSCNGLGFAYFRPTTYKVNTAELGNFDKEQQYALNRANAVAIRGLLISCTSDPDMFRVLGNWVFGSCKITVRAENQLSYMDRIIQIDETMSYSEVLESDGSGKLKTKYSVVAINELRSFTDRFDDTDVDVVAGEVTWKTGKEPVTGTRLSIHYQCHPVWVCLQHLHLTRSSLAKFKAPVSQLQTPEGTLISLPTEHLLRLEHLDLTPG